MLIGEMSPALLAGLLYLGSGIGLELFLLFRGENPFREIYLISPDNRKKLIGALLSGGIIAPLCLTYGIKYGPASEVALLLNLETVATTVISWLIFKEHIGPWVWSGKFLILLAAAGIVVRTGGEPTLSLPGLLVVTACIFWGIDNCLTREVGDLSSINLAGIKGLGAGLFNITLSTLFTTGESTPLQIGGATAIGALSYGLSLVLFIEALRRIGAARTSTFFAVGPFIGALLSIALLGERPPPTFWLAAFFMLGGIFLLCQERHGHLHTHDRLLHRHPHLHDDHHLHLHGKEEDEDGHDHSHAHETLTHIHAHWPDIHHRHGHRGD
jgi:drug/metabolite transporter (DMT)-like permease